MAAITQDIQTFTSFSDADEADRKERWAMSIEERMILLETLRSYMYPHGKPTPRLQRVLSSVKQTQG